jgi:hypothetical protein
VKYYFPVAKTIEEYWKMTKIAISKGNFHLDSSETVEIAIHSFKQLIGKMKSNTSVKNPYAYYYGILHKKLGEHIISQFSNWLVL